MQFPIVSRVIQVIAPSLALAFGLVTAAAGDVAGNQADPPIRIGVLAYRGSENALRHWTPHADFLNRRLAPRRFEIVPMHYGDLTEAARRREIQLLITNTGHYVEMELAGGVSRIATRTMAGPAGPLDRFGGTVITRAGKAGIDRYASLKGLRLMVPDKSSLGGWQVHLREAIEQGIDLERDVESLVETRNHEKVVEGVLAGQADVGFVRSDLLEAMAAEGRIRLADLHVVNERHTPGYPYLHSTRLYPEWPLARVAGVSDQLAKDVLIELLAMAPDDPAARAAGIRGWTLPQNYQSVHDLFRDARLGPYANLPITFDDIVARYGRPLAALILLAFLCLVGIAWYVNGVNQNLKREMRRRVEAEQSLEESDRNFRAMADALPTLIWLADTAMLCTFFNRAWLEFTGRGLDRELGTGWTSGVHPDDQERCLKTYRDAFEARKPFEMQYRLRHASGEYRWIVDAGTPRYTVDGTFNGYFGHCMDVTEMQRLTEALAEGRERYALAQRAAHIASLDWDVESDRLRFSDEIEAMFGFAPGNIARSVDAFLACVHPADRPALQRAIETAIKKDRNYAIEHRIVRPDGTVRWVEQTGDIIRDEEDRATRMIGIVQDITARRQAEEGLRQSNKQLAASLAALQRHTEDLTHINEMNEFLQSCLREEEIHEVFGHMARTLNLGSGGMLAVLRPPGRALHSAATWGDAEGMDALFTLNECWGIRRGQIHEPVTGQAGLHCAHLRVRPAHLTLCQPMVVQGETLGLITVRAPAEIGTDAWLRIRQLSVTLGEALKLAISNIRLREALREQATRDPLTGLFNRRYLDETLPRELHAALREDQTLSLAIIDLDNFKHYNDTWGHEAGDQVLIQVSRFLREHLRASDIACRFGGEELVAVMPGAELQEARDRIARIADLLRHAELHIDDRPLPTVTFSAGIALAPLHGDHADALLRAADQALYAAKQAGRDRIFTVGQGT